MGFGYFYLSDLSTFNELSDSDVTLIKAYILEKEFWCTDSDYFNGDEVGCGHSFNPLKTETTASQEDRTRAILFG